MEAIVLAGGLGSRLAGRLQGLPKSMAPVAGRPFLEIVLRQLRIAGCTRVVLAVGHLRAMIQDHFGPEFNGMRIEYSIETSPLGTGGAIRQALAQTTEDSVLVMNGDTYLQADYADMMRFHSVEGAIVTIATVQRSNISRYGGVLVDQKRIVAFEEKGCSGPGYINAGVYVLPRNLGWPPHLKEKFSIEFDFFVPEISRLRPAAYEVSGYFLDIGLPEDLDRAQTELAGIE